MNHFRLLIDVVMVWKLSSMITDIPPFVRHLCSPPALPCEARGTSSPAWPTPTAPCCVAPSHAHASADQRGTHACPHGVASGLGFAPCWHHACSAAIRWTCKNKSNICRLSGQPKLTKGWTTIDLQASSMGQNQFKYFFTPFERKRGCHTWITNKGIKSPCIWDSLSQSTQ